MIITGAQVKAARLLLGWSQPKLAAETGVSAATIAKFEEGQRRKKPSAVRGVALHHC
jgi:transcriptional regulator with XRE-family HTH domain